MANSIEMSTTVPTFTQPLPVKAGVTIQAGALFALDSLGRAVPANDATAALIAGRALTEYANTLPGALDGDLTVMAERKAYVVQNSATDPVGVADVMKVVFLENSNIVRKNRTGSQPAAGVLLGFDGVFPMIQMVPGVDSRPTPLYTYLTNSGTVALTAAQSGLSYNTGLAGGGITSVTTLPPATVGLEFTFNQRLLPPASATAIVRPQPLDVMQNIYGSGNHAAGKGFTNASSGGAILQVRCYAPGVWTTLVAMGTFNIEP